MLLKLLLSVLFLVFWGYLLTKITRNNRQGKWRLGLMVLIAASVMAVMWLPTNRLAKNLPIKVLTSGSADSLSSDPQAIHLQATAAGFRKWATLIADSAQKLEVYGQGLPTDWLLLSTAENLQFHPAQAEAGILALDLPGTIPLGDTLRFPCRWRGKSLQLRYNDSTVWQTQVDDSSELVWPVHYPAEAGLHAYQLIAAADTVEFYVTVAPSKTLNIALFSSFPQVEHKFLIDWLKQEGHRVYGESLLRPGLKYKRSVGTDASKAWEDALATADLLLMDAGRYQSLSDRQKVELEKFVAGGKSVAFWPEAGSPLPVDGGSLVPQSTALPLAIFADYPITGAQLQLKKPAEPVYRWQNHQPAVSLQADGFGRWAWLGIQTTYTWHLQGHQAVYDQYWRKLLRQLQPYSAAPGVSLGSWPNRLHRAVTLQLQQEGLPQVGWVISPTGDSLALKFLEKRPYAGLWEASFWPDTVGTYRWVQQEQEVLVAISPETSFPAARCWQLQQYLNRSLEGKGNAGAATRPATVGLQPVWKLICVAFLLLLLIGLWSLEKFSR